MHDTTSLRMSSDQQRCRHLPRSSVSQQDWTEIAQLDALLAQAG